MTLSYETTIEAASRLYGCSRVADRVDYGAFCDKYCCGDIPNYPSMKTKSFSRKVNNGGHLSFCCHFTYCNCMGDVDA